MSLFDKLETWSSLPLRLVVGTIFLAHGSQKLFVYGLAGTAGAFDQIELYPGILWGTLAALTEFLGGLTVLLGLGTRLAALGLAVVMAVAIIKVHLTGGFFAPKGFEYPLALLGASLSLVFSGSKVLALDPLLGKAIGRLLEQPRSSLSFRKAG